MANRHFVFIILLFLGGLFTFFLAPFEVEMVRKHLSSFPNAAFCSHSIRPIFLGVLCFLPALFSLYYFLSAAIDRYLIKHLLGSFFMCFGAFFLIWILLDVNDNMDKFAQAKNTFLFLGRYYLVAFPALFVLLAPYALLLSLLHSLGKLSKSKEVIAIVQTGRGITRLIFPLGIFGLFVTIACLLFNFHWAPWAEGYRRAMVEKLRHGVSSQASQVTYFDKTSKRFWYVEHFPYEHSHGAPLNQVRVVEKQNNTPVRILRAQQAIWHPQSKQWAFYQVVETDLTKHPMPKHTSHPGPLYKPWAESPGKIIKPGLSPLNMGIPDLNSWLNEHQKNEWIDRSPYLTQWHYRWAQPWICLIIVFIATPLGVAFTRRGPAGSVVVAIFLCAGIMFLSTVFLAFGESDNISPVLAAWATNLLFLGISFILIYQRNSGRPLYQTLKQYLLPRS